MYIKNSLSIVVPVYNSENTIEKCLLTIINEIKKIKHNEFEIIIVDDNSNDNTNNIIRKFKEVKLIKLKKNKGVGYARNIGARIAKNEILCYIDSDLIISENSILSLLKRLLQNDNIGSVGAIPVLPNLNLKQWSSNFVALKSLYGFREIKSEYYVSEAQSEFFVIYRDFLKKIGGWKAYRNAGGEEYELGYRINLFGKKNLKIKNATYTTYWDGLYSRFKKVIDRTEKYLSIFLKKKKFETSESFVSSSQALSAISSSLMILLIFLSLFFNKPIINLGIFLSIFFQLFFEYKFLIYAQRLFGLKMFFFSLFGILIINMGILLGVFMFIIKYFKNFIKKINCL